MRYRVPVATTGLLLLLVAIAVIAWPSRHPPTKTAALTARDLQRLQDRIEHDRGALRHEGVFIDSTGQTGRPCVSVDLANPTAPNRAWLTDRYGPGICTPIQASGGIGVVTQMGCANGPGRRIAVPDLVGLRADIARRRLLAAGFTEACNHHTGGDAPDRYSVGNALYVTAVCDRSARRGGFVRLAVSGRLPGGFRITDQTCDD